MNNLDNSADYVDNRAEELATSSEGHVPLNNLHASEPEKSALSAAQNTSGLDHARRTTGQSTTPARNYGELTKLVGELTKLVVSLQREKLMLEKLVMAQLVVIEDEKQMHRKTKVIAHEAITVMRRATDRERGAMKIARHERRKRQRLEDGSAKACSQLENALSTRRVKDSANLSP